VEVSNTTDIVSDLGLLGSPVCPQKASPAQNRADGDHESLARLVFCVTGYKGYLGRTTENCIFNLPKVAQH
jgi:hypothetical protein